MWPLPRELEGITQGSPLCLGGGMAGSPAQVPTPGARTAHWGRTPQPVGTRRRAVPALKPAAVTCEAGELPPGAEA